MFGSISNLLEFLYFGICKIIFFEKAARLSGNKNNNFKINKLFLEKAPRYSRDIHSKKLPAESAIPIASRHREKWGRRLRCRHPRRNPWEGSSRPRA